jgi:hypothetical protein
MKKTLRRSKLRHMSNILFYKEFHENDVIHDTHKVICNINIKQFRRYWQIRRYLHIRQYWHWKYFSEKSGNCVGFFRRYRASPVMMYFQIFDRKSEIIYESSFLIVGNNDHNRINHTNSKTKKIQTSII